MPPGRGNGWPEGGGGNAAPDPDQVVEYGRDGRVVLTTLTKELFIPRFKERDEGVRGRPSAKYPWDGVSSVKPYRGIASTTVVGVY